MYNLTVYREVLWKPDNLPQKLALLNKETVALDTETSSSKKRDRMCADKSCKPGKTPEALVYSELFLTGVSLCDGTYNYYIPVCAETEPEVINHLLKFLNSVKRIVAHNWVYDAMVLHKHGISISNIKRFDTMVAYHLIDENDQKGLKYLSNKLLGYEVEKFDPDLNHYTQEFFEYGLNDTKYTWELYNYLYPLLFEEKVDKLFFKTLMPWQSVLLEMKIEGVIVDRKLLNQQAYKLKQLILDLRVELNEYLGEKYSMQVTLDPTQIPEIVGGFNPNSSLQKIEACNKLGIDITEKTPTGAPSVGKAFLYANLDKPFIKLLTRYVKAEKMYSSFLSDRGQIVTNIEKDGKVRTSFKDTGTKTGRLSSSNPNFQQLANPTCLYCLGADFTDGVCDECGKLYEFNVRSTLKAPVGYVMFSCDYSGQETYTMAHLCKDPTLVKMLQMGQDQHFVNANAVFKLGIPDDYMIKSHPKFKEIKAKYKSYRSKGKIFSFGVPYGMTEHKAKKDFNISLEEAKKLIDNLWESFPLLKKAIEATHKEAEEKGFVRTLVNRRRRWDTDEKVDMAEPWGLGKAQRQSFNFKIQGLCADMVRMAGVNVAKRTKEEWGLKPILTIHDEIVYIVKEEYVKEATDCVKQCFEHVTKNLVVPIPVSIEIGDSYGTAK